MASFIVVEDDLTVRYLLKDIVAALGHQLIAAVDNIQAAIKFIQAGRVPDVILLDLVLPGETGVKMIDYVRGNNLKTRVILTTGLGDEQVLKLVPEGGYDALIQKPFSIDQMAALVNSMLPATGNPPLSPQDGAQPK